jgi:type I restriction enzyme, S subunit
MMWEKVKLEDVCKKITSGGTPLRSVMEYYDGGIISWIKTKEVNFNRIYNSDEKITERGLEESSAKLIPENSILIAMYGDGNTAGRCAINRIPVTTNQACCNLIINQEIANSDFIFYKISTLYEILKGLKSGGSQQNLNAKTIREFKIDLPPLPTQRRIATLLSSYDDLIENNLRRIKLLEEQAELRYKEIVRNEEMEEVTIEELAEVIMGQSPTSDTYNEEKEGLPFHQGVTNFSNYFVENKIYCKLPLKIANEGDILFSVRAPVGRINFTTEKICIGRGLCAFRSKKGFQNFFFQQLKGFFFKDDVIGNGAIFNAVTKAELLKVRLKTPSYKTQKTFEKEAQPMYDLILNLSTQNAQLRQARDILLPRLMSGEIAV